MRNSYQWFIRYDLSNLVLVHITITDKTP